MDKLRFAGGFAAGVVVFCGVFAFVSWSVDVAGMAADERFGLVAGAAIFGMFGAFFAQWS